MKSKAPALRPNSLPAAKKRLPLGRFLRFLRGRFVSTSTIFAPAKLNLFLAITGRRTDGFHDLVSVVAQLAIGDTLSLVAAEGWTMTSDSADVPVDETNLVLKAARAFATATGDGRGGCFHLEKRSPVGAGLGGGSSDAVAALRLLNARLAQPLGLERLTEIAASLGSDCPLFLHDGPVVMRGRGERVERLPERAVARLQGRRVLVFKPAFGISTPWAYGQLAAGAPGSYRPAADAEAVLAQWIEGEEPAERLLWNGMEPPVFRKFVAIPTLLDELRANFGLAPRLSGSGSACYALVEKGYNLAPVVEAIREAWGDSAFILDTYLR